MKNIPIRSQRSETIIGKTTYIVTTHFKEAARETAEDKMLRIITDRIAAELKGKTP
jgi:hypothetical protein